MAITSKTLTAAPQSRKRHTVYRNGKLVRVYYTDSGKDTGGGTATKKMIHSGKDHKGKGAKGMWAPTQQMINEFRSYGRDFIQQKYKLSTARLNYLSAAINKAADGKTGPVAKSGFIAASGRFGDGGPVQASTDNPVFQRKMMLNLENDSDKAQGSHHEWAQPTSISSLITSQLRQSQNAPADFFEAWASTKGGKTELLARDSSSFGIDVKYTPDSEAGTAMAEEESLVAYGPQTKMAESNSMGAFGTTMVMDPFYGEDQEEHSADDGHGHGVTPEGDQYSATNLPAGAGSDGLVNPWSEGYGGAQNAYGPSAQTMAAATMEAMALANAYFAPQRMELAYQLGDMETDMRRLAVNLGRQVDDPVLQAKLYKEGMRAVRTLDVQQNSMAFQMAEGRRQEELRNFQFYDQLAQNEYQLRIQDEQWAQDYALRENQYKLQYKQLEMMHDAANPPTPSSSEVPGTEDSPVGGQTPPPTQNAPVTTPKFNFADYLSNPILTSNYSSNQGKPGPGNLL